MPRSGSGTKSAILDAANRIVREKGAEHLTLELTAAEAGISKGGLLYHFPTKEALIQGMILDYLERFSRDYEQIARADPQTAGSWTRSYLQVTAQDQQRAPGMSSGLLAAAATDPSLLIPLQTNFQEWVAKLGSDGIDPVQAMIVRLAVDGLWMVELFGLGAPDAESRQRILQALEDMTRTR